MIPLDMFNVDDYFTLGEAEIYINAEDKSFLGRAKLLDWQLGDEFFEAGGPSLEIGWDQTKDRFWYKAHLEASATIKAGGASLELSPSDYGAMFEFETGIRRPYWLIRAGVSFPQISIDEVLIEIDPTGNAQLTPTYPVGNILTQPIRGHLRFLGDVTVGIPLPLPLTAQGQPEEAPDGRDERRSEPDMRPEDAPSLDVHVVGESLFRLDLSGGCDFGYAANATIGLGVSAGPLGLMYDFGGSSMYLDIGGTDFEHGCYPELLAIALVQNGIELSDIAGSYLGDLGRINLTPQVGVAVEFDIPARTMQLAGEYEVGPFEFAASFLLDVDEKEMAITATLDMAVARRRCGAAQARWTSTAT